MDLIRLAERFWKDVDSPKGPPSWKQSDADNKGLQHPGEFYIALHEDPTLSDIIEPKY